MRTFNQTERVYAGFWVRLGALFLDGVIVLGLQLAMRLVLALTFGIFGGSSFLNTEVLFQYTCKDVLLYAAGALYFVLCTYYAGATLGKKAMNLQVVSSDGTPLTFINVLFRETVGRFLSAFVLCIGYLLAGVTNEKTGLHDILCDTRVIYAKKIPVYANGEINKRYVHYDPAGKTPADAKAENPEPDLSAGGEREPDAGAEFACSECFQTAGEQSAEATQPMQRNLSMAQDTSDDAPSQQMRRNMQTQDAAIPQQIPRPVLKTETVKQEEPPRTVPPQIQSAAPSRIIETPNKRIQIYDRYIHVDPENSKNEKGPQGR